MSFSMLLFIMFSMFLIISTHILTWMCNINWILLILLSQTSFFSMFTKKLFHLIMFHQPSPRFRKLRHSIQDFMLRSSNKICIMSHRVQRIFHHILSRSHYHQILYAIFPCRYLILFSILNIMKQRCMSRTRCAGNNIKFAFIFIA